jgi:hypothetical protein
MVLQQRMNLGVLQPGLNKVWLVAKLMVWKVIASCVWGLWVEVAV